MFRKLHSLSKSRLPFKRPESVYFYTLHKCASSLFSDYVLKHVRRLRLVDYMDRFYNGEPIECVTFREKGFIYGPIRLSTEPHSAIYDRLIEPASRNDFIRNKIAIFLIRDPRDILVSCYYSFGYTHEFSAVKEIEEQQRRARELIRRMTIDTFALEVANPILNHFHILDRLSQACNRGIVLKYEDMIDNWEKFSSGLTKYLNIGRKTLRHTYKQTRPLENENETGFRRSGKPGAYRDKLLTSTVDALNIAFAPVLTRFHYER
jgi:Sulfotransferase domain